MGRIKKPSKSEEDTVDLSFEGKEEDSPVATAPTISQEVEEEIASVPLSLNVDLQRIDTTLSSLIADVEALKSELLVIKEDMREMRLHRAVATAPSISLLPPDYTPRHRG